MATLITDDFNRADSNAVGGGWTEVDNSAANNVRVASNQLRIGTEGDNVGGSQGVYQTHGTITLPCTLSWKYVPGSGVRGIRVGLWGTSSFAFQVGVRWQNADNSANNASLIDSTGDHDTPFQIDSTVTWYGWLDFVENGSNIDVSFYRSTTTTKPGSATKSSTNLTKNSDTNIRVSFDTSTTGQYFDMDDVLLSDSFNQGVRTIFF